MRTEHEAGKRKSTVAGLESSTGPFAGGASATDKGASQHQPEGRREDAGVPETDIVLVDVTRLSAEQRTTLHALARLYRSLCGAHPGQYWPQALLDSAGKFNRPPFPPAPRHRVPEG